MRNRAKITRQIIDAWQECVETDYPRQRINSERSLQASFWAQLNARLAGSRTTFIEPPVSAVQDSFPKTVFPDIVISNSREVIAVIELKFTPLRSPLYKKDIRNLDFIARNRKAISIGNTRYSGPRADPKVYAVSENALFVWAGIHRGDSAEIDPDFAEKFPALNGCFFQLHAATRSAGDPGVYYYR